MKEYSQFIRWLLEPDEDELVLMVNKYVDEYKMII